MRTKATIAVLLPYWKFWESSAGGPGFRTDRRRLLDEVVEVLTGKGMEVRWNGLVDSSESGAQAAAEIDSSGAQVLLVVQSMAVPPAYTLTALDLLPGLPLVVWPSSVPGGCGTDSISLISRCWAPP